MALVGLSEVHQKQRTYLTFSPSPKAFPALTTNMKRTPVRLAGTYINSMLTLFSLFPLANPFIPLLSIFATGNQQVLH